MLDKNLERETAAGDFLILRRIGQNEDHPIPTKA